MFQLKLELLKFLNKELVEHEKMILYEKNKNAWDYKVGLVTLVLNQLVRVIAQNLVISQYRIR